MKKGILLSLLMTMALFAEGAAAPKAGGSSASFIPMMVVMFVVLWFFMIRPEQKKQKAAQAMRENVNKGDKVVTAGGICGTVQKIVDDRVIIGLDKHSTLTVLKTSIATIESADGTIDTEPTIEESK